MLRSSPFCYSKVLAGCALLLLVGCARRNFYQPDARLQATEAVGPATDSVRQVTAGRQYNRHGGLYRALVGAHYRRTWGAAVTVPVFRAARAVPGGLQPTKIGGGFNSTSLGLSGPDGQGYVLRTVDKDPGRATPPLLRRTFLVNVLRDNVSSTQPYAALVVPPLAAAVSVPHTSPRLYYTRPDDPAFASDSLKNFRGQLAWVEEKFSGSAAQVPGLGKVAVTNSDKAFAAVFASPTQRIDQPALLRARLLDALLGDWDRHVGQWNWAKVPRATGRGTALLPLPKDRDMAFFRLDDGVLGWLIGHLALRHWTTFRSHYPSIASLMSSGRYIDTRGLNELSSAQFQACAIAMQHQLPDSLLARAVRRLPRPAFMLEGERTTAALRSRRDALPALAHTYYRLLAKHVVVGGTAQAERFEVQRFADSTVVKVFAQGSSVPFYQRTFLPSQTRRIQLEGLGADDAFNIVATKGAARPRLRLYGGAGADTYSAAGAGRGVRFYEGSAPAKKAFDTPPAE